MRQGELDRLYDTIKGLDDLHRNWPNDSNFGIVLWADWLANPVHEGFFKLCRSQINNYAISGWQYIPEKWSVLLETAIGHDQNIIRAHLECVNIILNNTNYFSDPQSDLDVHKFGLERTARDLELRPGFIFDLFLRLLGRERKALTSITVSILLIDETVYKNGLLGNLQIDVMPNGNGSIYQNTDRAFVASNEVFKKGWIAVEAFLKQESDLWPADIDIRWSINNKSDLAIKELRGASATAAFASHARELLRAIKGQPLIWLMPGKIATMPVPGSSSTPFTPVASWLSQLAITAVLDPNRLHEGRLLPVNDNTLSAKLNAGFYNQSFPRIRYIAVAASQALAQYPLQPQTDPRILKVPDMPCFVLKAETLDDIHELVLKLEQRRSLPEVSLPPVCADFVGRERLFARVDDFIDKQRSGFLVLVGGMGRGKTTFLREYVRRYAEQVQEPPVAHFISQRGDNAQDICDGLYRQLLDKYLVEEPTDPQTDAVRRLEWLLKQLHEQFQRRARPEVLFIDAADQAELDSRKGLVPGVLDLPEGVVCVLTTRPDQGWLRDSRNVTLCPLDEAVVDDRTDIAVYLRQQARQHIPLTDDFIATLVDQPTAPMFFTVRQCLREYQQGTAAQRQRLTTTVAPWLTAPELLIENQALALETWAEEKDIDPGQVWRTLGYLALAQAALGQVEWEAFGLWGEGIEPRVLRQAVNFFAPRQRVTDVDTPYCFDHPGYHREVLRRCTPTAQQAIQRQLAAACGRWAELEGVARTYALRYLPTHLLEAQHWDCLRTVLLDVNAYLLQRIKLCINQMQEFAALLSDIKAVTPKFPELNDLHKVLEQNSHLLCTADMPPLQQIVYNRLSAVWGDCPELNAVLRQAEAYQGPWLKDLNPQEYVTAFMREVRQPSRPTTLAVISTLDNTGPLIACGCADGQIRLWNWYMYPQGLVLSGTHKGSVTALAACGQSCLASGGVDGRVYVWQTLTGQPVLYSEFAEPVRALAFSGDSKVLACAVGSTVQLLSFTEEQLPSLRRHGQVNALAFSPDGTLLAAAGEDCEVALWSLPQYERLPAIQPHARKNITCIAFSPNDRWLASGSAHQIQLTCLQEPRHKIRFNSENHYIRTLAFSSDSRWLAFSYDGDKNIHLMRLDTYTSCTLGSHGDTVIALAFFPEHEESALYLASCATNDDSVRLWRLPADRQQSIPTITRPVVHRKMPLVFIKDRLAGFDEYGKLVLWETFTSKPEVITGHSLTSKTVMVACERKNCLLIGSDKGHLLLWTLDPKAVHELGMLDSPIDAVALAVDGTCLASGDRNGELYLWCHTNTAFQRVWCMPVFERGISAIALSPDLYYLAAACPETGIKVWSIGLDNLKQQCHFDVQGIYVLAFSPCGKWLAGYGHQGLWLRCLQASENAIMAKQQVGTGTALLAFSADSHWLLTATEQRVEVWSLAERRQIAVWVCHESIKAVCWHGSNLKIATLDADARLMVFDLELKVPPSAVR